MDHLKYLSGFIFPGCVAWFLYSGPHDTVDALAWTIPLWTLILMDWLSPKITPNKHKTIVSGWFYDLILYGLSCLQFLIISLLLIYASQLQWGTVFEIMTSLVNLLVLRILVGTTSGSSAIIVAHELIHRPKSYQRLLGQFLLYTVCYEHFIIAHLRGHHSNVATPEDITTARLDESFECYWKRVTIGNFKYAWNSELERLGLIQTQLFHYKMLANSVLQGLIVEVALLLIILMVFGWAAAIIFLYQAFSGVRLLETINYYQHWGLENGRSRNVLAWANQSLVTEYALVGLSNHISHHQNASTFFYQTPYSSEGPKMPYGYFVTNLWVKLNNASYRQVSAERLKQ
ncbi:MAG: fatty acid desaturase [Methylococcales bacterium]|nr:fatty acid desaturase [Methylococcales bacterium]